MKLIHLVLSVVFPAAMLAACGDGGGESVLLVVPTDAALAANSTTTSGVKDVPFVFRTGVPDFGTTTTTTVTFTSAAASPTFSISSGGNTATGQTSFGSCIFVVSASTFPAGSRLAAGNTVVVNPCNINVQTAGLQATGVGTTRSVALALGAAVSSGSSITVSVNPGGQLTLNGVSVGTVTLVPVTG